MEKYFSVFNSDQESKDGKSFTISALEDGIWQTAVHGIPSNLSHDIHRPVGWSFPKGLYFEPRRVLTVGYFLISESQEDIQQLFQTRKAFYRSILIKEIQPYQEGFKVALGNVYSEKKGHWFANGLVLYGYDNIVFTAFPELADHIAKDKDGLVNLEYLLREFEYVSQGVFKKKNSELAIIAHPYFRKSQSIYNNFHWIFLDELVSLHTRKDITIKIKIDTDFLGYAPSFLETFEFEYWWGPQYSDDITAIRPGLTQYGSDEHEKLYYNIHRSEFVWKSEGALYTLEAEEVKNEVAPTLADTYACRYIHSIFDESKNCFDHFDGAIRAYSTELMIERIGKNMTEMGRRSVYTKLFRVDGNLPLSNWKSLVTNYLQGNPQIYEYFGLPKPDIQKILKEESPTVLEKYVPYSISEGDGVRLFVSYHSKDAAQPHERFISVCDVVTLEDGEKDAVEYFVIELKKALNRLGTDLVLPENCIYMLPEDYYANIPCIFHNDVNTHKLVNDTIEALRNVVDGLVIRSKKQVISSTLAWNIEDKEVQVSIMGYVSDLKKWLYSFNDLPVEREALKEWLTKQADYFYKNGKETRCPVLSGVFNGDGVLYMKRRLVQKDVILTHPNKSNLMEYTIEYNENQKDLAEALKSGHLNITPTLILEKMKCLKDGLDYTLSPYSVVLDDDVHQEVAECKLISFHWTDKPRPISFK